MDDVAFSLMRTPGAGGFPEIGVVVNGRPLQELAAAVEARSAAAAGEPQLAGDYQGLRTFDIHTSRHYVDQPNLTEDGRTVLLSCATCGKWKCWSLTARIMPDDETVVWRDFLNPQRPAWDWSELGPFWFDRAAYESAVATLAEAIEPNPTAR